MKRWHHHQSGTAALMAMAISTGAIVPVFLPSPATAQMFPESFRRRAISAGAVIPVTYSKDKIVLTAKETKSLELEIANNIVDNRGNVLITSGSKITGQLEPATVNGEEGSQFVAKELISPDGRRQRIDAVSNVITRKETIRRGSNTRRILTGAAIGTGAAALISLITGDNKINLTEILAGSGLGAAAGAVLRRRKVEVIMIEPNKGDLDVTLRSNFALPDNR
ncbi:MAG: conjugal transfer protein TrbI [Calothrix sp. MO_167.B42]|nr:conjugal transfer protein TrbI [Calothrix sp. MO_167.B42]